MSSPFTYKIFQHTAELPESWELITKKNIFLSKAYLEVLETAPPRNMCCFYIGLFNEEKLIGIALAQCLDLNQLQSFGERDRCLKTQIRNFVFKRFASHVLFIGNNMLTGQNAFAFLDGIPIQEALGTLNIAVKHLKTQLKGEKRQIHLTSIKDFNPNDIKLFETPEYSKHYVFTTQPNMIFSIKPNWYDEDDYVAALIKKYRDQYKRARKKIIGIEKRKMNLEAIVAQEDLIYELYYHVAKNAPFNTFFLPKNHFSVFKEKLKGDFLFYGYFENGKMIGFNTLIKNGNNLDTYFLGYDDTVQKQKLLYLNMLYDMIGYAIGKKYDHISFGRTALEIKSSVGAKPNEMFGLIEHSDRLINSIMSVIFPYLEPEMQWHERNPFL